ncbi:MAG: sigma-54 dependent transcriptional regulator [Nitrospirae bacterium]|jgi:two-component system response regulator AtoC|nr:sigma-54 dependent transcriptional regulator [Nitrospirota bacterium]
MRILVIDDDESLLDVLTSALEKDGHEVRSVFEPEMGFVCLKNADWDVVLLDMRLKTEDGFEVLRKIRSARPDMIILMMTAFGKIEQAVEAMKLGAFDFLEKPFSLSFLRIKLEKIQSHLSLKTQNGILREELESKKWTLVGHHTRIQEVREQITRYSKVDSPVLILGESGTGKEIAARMIVNQSSRRYEPFIVVNCGAIPMDLMESMFFGHEKGSFTGAHALQKGKFELARGGTIFLDEIGELPWALQAKLLRIIETGEFERIGGKQTLKTDARIISATNRNLENLVKKDVFRLDLYYRLNVLVLEMPSLCERLEDLPYLVEYLLKELSVDLHRKLIADKSLIPALQRAEWPGNIRELKNVLERLAVISEDGVIREKDFAQVLWKKPPFENSGKIWEVSFKKEIQEREKEMILVALEKAEGNHTLAAHYLGMKRTTFQYRLKKMKIG